FFILPLIYNLEQFAEERGGGPCPGSEVTGLCCPYRAWVIRTSFPGLGCAGLTGRGDVVMMG
ncbi:MAG: hypothetical protein Q4G68_14545, partial [Planctomycetia bacterium]|nr:hypothetical protein [Planctomycetia bacterium]